MKNVFRIFADDVKHGVGNSLAVVVLVGLMLLPAMYAWFNDAASWDPYHHTEGLKVAVATQDEGYKSDLLPIKVNIGDMVESELRANSSFDWQFVTSDEAVEGVKSGKYYAALVIPSTFSSDMMSIFNENSQTAQIDYYVNEKINPIASHVTDVGADTVQESIRTAFSSTVADVGLSVLGDLSAYGSSSDLQSYAERVGARIDASVQDTRSAADSVRALGNLVGAVNTLVDSSSKVMDGAGSSSQSAKDTISDASSALGDATDSLDGVTDRVNDALFASAASFDALRDQSDAAFDALGASAGDASSALRTVAGKADDQRAAFQQVRDAMADLGLATNEIDGVIESLDQASSALSESADNIDSGVTDAAASKQEVRDAVDAAKADVTQLQDSYESDLKSQVDALESSLSTVASSSDAVSEKLADTADSLSAATGSLSERLGQTKAA
ncbi:MAG: YhgE/Pip family protein, partial [Denitrobacterium sp.]|nr:YhgE/Pip family protein [Denitrobacterium sp.]